jgi:hypothetical protein
MTHQTTHQPETALSERCRKSQRQGLFCLQALTQKKNRPEVPGLQEKVDELASQRFGYLAWPRARCLNNFFLD